MVSGDELMHVKNKMKNVKKATDHLMVIPKENFTDYYEIQKENLDECK